MLHENIIRLNGRGATRIQFKSRELTHEPGATLRAELSRELTSRTIPPLNFTE